jgi:hypothetical protein
MWPAGLGCMLLQHMQVATRFLGSIGRCYGEGKEKYAEIKTDLAVSRKIMVSLVQLNNQLSGDKEYALSPRNIFMLCCLRPYWDRNTL